MNISGRVTFTNCYSEEDGGGLYFRPVGGQVFASNIYVYNCSANFTGGGLAGSMGEYGQITLDDECEF